MSDRTSTGGRPPTAHDPDEAKPTPVSTQLTFSQHLFIWTLIVVVGVLFGMGGSMQVFFERGGGPVHGVSEREIEQRRDIIQRLGKVLQEDRMALYSQDPLVTEIRRGISSGYSNEFISFEIRLAAIARKAGCSPIGATLDDYVNHWLDQDRFGHTNRALLSEAVGGDHEVHFDDLRAFAADVIAYKEYQDRHVYSPAVPTAVSSQIALLEDKVMVDSAVLPEGGFIKPIDPKDPRLLDTYDRMRRLGSFVKPESVALTVAYSDIAALTKAAAASITDAEAKAYYESHKAEPQYAQPRKPEPTQPKATPQTPAKPSPQSPQSPQTPAKPTPPAAPAKEAPPVPKPYAEVRQGIIDQLAATKAQAAAKAAVEAFDKAIGDQGLDGQKDPAGFIQAAKTAGLVTASLSVDRPTKQASRGQGEEAEETLTVGAIGTMLDDAQLFAPDKEAGFTSRPIQVSGAHPTWALVRLESRTEKGYKSLAEVQPEVMAYLQNRSAYSDFIAAAKQARADAQKLGAGGLKAYFASPAGAHWKATVVSSTLPVSDALVPPPDQADAPAPTDSAIAGSLALGDHAVALVGVSASEDDKNALPTVKLIQGTGFVGGTQKEQPEQKPRVAEGYREALKRFGDALFSPTVERQLR